MLMSTRTIAALRCSKCGKMDLYSISRFSCGKNGHIKIFCDCGHCIMMLNRKGRNTYYLQTECLICEAKHIFKLQGKEIWNTQAYSLICQNTGLEIAHLGNKGDVIRSIQQGEQTVRELIKELDYEQYVQNPEVMQRILEIVRNLLAKNLISCSCGTQQLEIDVFPEHIEVYCPYCHAVGIIFAETAEDLQKVKLMRGFELQANSCCSLDDKRVKRKGKVKNK